jgi:hypothetical protein
MEFITLWNDRSGELPLSGELGKRFFATKECVYFGLAETSVPAWRPDAADATRRGPSGHGLRVDSEERSDLSGGQQALARTLHVLSPFVPLSVRVDCF